MQLKKILIKTKRSVFSEISGNNASIFKGEGYDFVELREYQVGDDVKKIDWIISAKLQKPYVKLFREERELNVVVASILNGSTYFGTKKFKQELIAEISAIIAYSAIKNSDLFSSFIFADKLYSYTKPSKKLFSVHKMSEDILNFNPLEKGVNYESLKDTLLNRVKRKSLTFIVSDFFGEVDFKLLNKKHEVIAIIVRDRLEENPPNLGFISLVDPENNTMLEGDLNENTTKKYKKAIIENDRKLYAHFKKNAIRFVKIYTDEEPFPKLLKLFGTKK